MSATKETLEERVREQDLLTRLEECQRRIGKMCSEGRGPRMSIPVRYDDDDFYICTTLRDAIQAHAAGKRAEEANDELREQLAARMYTWTAARPTVPGWYWFRSADAVSKWPDMSPVLIQVVVLPTTGELTILWAADNQPVTQYNDLGEWSDQPIALPEEGT